MDSLYDKVTPGVKFLLCLKNQNINTDCIPDLALYERPEHQEKYDEEIAQLQDSLNIDNFENEITDEEYSKNLKEMDDLIKDIMKTKHEIRVKKLSETIKTDEEFLSYIQSNRKVPDYPDPPLEGSLGLAGLPVPSIDEAKALEYDEIQEHLIKQEAEIRSKCKQTVLSDYKLVKSSDLYITSVAREHDLTAEVRDIDSHFESMINDIDSIIKMGEDIDNMINNIKEN